MTSRDNGLWLKFWRDQRTDFHQEAANSLLIRYWPEFNLIPASRVFVPMCGKSLDMLWLAEQGHEVMGIELSPVAIKAFFKENNLYAHKSRAGKFILWQHDKISILCGDYFSLVQADLGNIDIVYDRAALTALPADVRKRYAAHLQVIAPHTEQMFLLTAEDVEPLIELDTPELIDPEIFNLYADQFTIDVAHCEQRSISDPADLTSNPEITEYKVYQLSSRH